MSFDRPRGTRDFSQQQMAERRWLERSFRETFRRFGYREIQTPTFESTELFTAKSGPNIVKEIYEFADKGGRSICLRPELTAPVMRYYFNELTHEPKPLKLFYHGPCYRYEEPQEGRYREFWQFGLELIGPEGPAADAESVAVAWHALRDAGLQNFILHLGHIGILRALVGALPISDAKKAETFRRIDKDDAELATFLSDEGADDASAEAIVSISRHERALDLADAKAVEGYFTEARAMLEGHAVLATVTPAFDALRQTVELLRAYGVDSLHLDMGVARGLDYYTGMVFELEAPDLGAQKQIGGGGAYSLHEIFEAQPVGSAGFGLGFDRILLALAKENAIPAATPPAAVYVAILGDGARVPALEIARDLRATGASVDVDLMGRSLSKSMQYAGKLGARLVIIAGEKDLAQGQVTLRDMTSGAQDGVPLADVVRVVGERLAG